MEIDINKLPTSEDHLKEIIISLHQSLQKFQNELQSSQYELNSYKERYVRLLEELRLVKQHRFSGSSEKFQSDLFDEPSAELPEDVKIQIAEEVEVSSYSRKKYPVRKPLPNDLPREIIIHDIPEAEKICHCGTHLVRIGEEITEQLKYIPHNYQLFNTYVLNMPANRAKRISRLHLCQYCCFLKALRQQN